jgi:hypothetical protein
LPHLPAFNALGKRPMPRTLRASSGLSILSNGGVIAAIRSKAIAVNIEGGLLAPLEIARACGYR